MCYCHNQKQKTKQQQKQLWDSKFQAILSVSVESKVAHSKAGMKKAFLFWEFITWTNAATSEINNSAGSSVQLSSAHFSCSVVAESWRPHGLQHARLPCPSRTPITYSNSCPSCRWCHPTISSSVVPFSSCLQSCPASGSFQMSQHFTAGGQSTGVSASKSVLPMNTQDWSPLGWTGWTSLHSMGLSRVFSNTTVQSNQFFCTQLSL